MITLKTIEIETNKDADSLLTHLQLLSEEPKMTSFSLFYSNFIKGASMQWVGKTDRSNRSFKLMRTKGHDFGVSLSHVLLKGTITDESTANLITIKLQPTTAVFLNNLLLTLLPIIAIILIPFETVKEMWWVFLFWTAGLLFNFISLGIDLNKTKTKIIELFDDIG